MQELDFGLLVKVGVQIEGVGGNLGQCTCRGGFGAGEVVIEGAAVAAGGVDGVGVGAHRLGAARVQVGFGDDAGRAADGRDEVVAGSVEAVAGDAYRGVDPVGLFDDLGVGVGVGVAGSGRRPWPAG